MEDHQLLTLFIHENSQPAFRQLVDRHTPWLYSVCLRRLRDPALAEDATQAVFLALAQKAPALLHHPTLSPWLHKAAKFAAAHLHRARQRRQHHESEAAAMTPTLGSPPPPDWLDLEPHLEPALDHLPTRDRQALLLRFYERKTFPQIAATLSITEPAAHKRVTRALERLRHLLQHPDRSTLAAPGLATLLLSHSIQPHPESLSATLSTLTNAPPHITALTQGILTMATISKIKSTTLAALLLLLAFGSITSIILLSSSKTGSPNVAVIPASPAASTTETPAPEPSTPLRTIFAMSESWARNEIPLYDQYHPPGTPDEKIYADAVHAIQLAQKKTIDTWHNLHDPARLTPFPTEALYIKGFTANQTAGIQVRPIDDTHAEVEVPGLLRYRLILHQGLWKIEILNSIANVYPADPLKATQILTTMFLELAANYDAATRDLESGTLNDLPTLTESLHTRQTRILETYQPKLTPLTTPPTSQLAGPR